MNVEGLLAHYARIADAPNAIAKLRRLVLDLAVRGRLGTQKPSESAAGAAENAKRVQKISNSKKPFGTPGSIIGQLPVPPRWAIVRLGEVLQMFNGRAFKPTDWIDEGLPIVRIQNLNNPSAPYNYCDPSSVDSRHLIHAGEFLISWSGTPGTSFGAFIWKRGTAALNQHIFRCVQIGDVYAKEFLRLAINSQLDLLISQAQGGVGLQHVTKRTLESLPLPLPPLEEQHRIVTKVDELMGLCDQLEAARAQREVTRDRLAAASLIRLNTIDLDTFTTDARFALDALPAITTRPDQIKQLRQTILNLAVRGKLSPYGVWQREPRPLSTVASLQNGYAFKSEWFAAQGTRLLRNVNVGHGNIDWANQACLPSERAIEYDRFRLRAGDLVLSLDRPFIATGTKVARVTAADLPALLLQRVGRFVLSNDITSQYLYLWINSPHFSAQINPGRSNGVPHISSKQVEAALLFLPPVSEQRRIVAKVDELMTLCDQLEASLTTGETTRSRLLDALLHEALATAQTESIEHPRAAVSAYVVSRLASKRNFGRTAHMKHLYLAESRLGLKLGGRYERQAAGPLDTGIYELEKQAEAAGWYTYNVEKLPSGKEKVSYVPGKALKALAEEGAAVLGPSRKEMDRLIDLMGGLKTEQVEIIATLFAVWNDAMLDGDPPDDDWIVREVRERWHASKQRFAPAELHKWLGWMRQNDVIPLGHPPRTMQQTTMEL
jgi:type I restriction enzyme S subunit